MRSPPHAVLILGLAGALAVAMRAAYADVIPQPSEVDMCLGKPEGVRCRGNSAEPVGECRYVAIRRPIDPRDPDAGIVEGASFECVPLPSQAPFAPASGRAAPRTGPTTSTGVASTAGAEQAPASPASVAPPPAESAPAAPSASAAATPSASARSCAGGLCGMAAAPSGGFPSWLLLAALVGATRRWRR